MKRQLALIAATSMLFTAVPVFAETNSKAADTENEINENVKEYDNALKYETLLKTGEKEGLETLTLDEATSLALTHSNSIKIANINLSAIEDTFDDYAEALTYNLSSDRMSLLLSYMKQQSEYKNSGKDLEANKQKIAYEMKKLFVDIINAERDISLKEEGLKLSKINYAISEQKNKYNLISNISLSEQKVSLENEKTTLQKLKNNLEVTYKNLNVLLGKSENTRYNISLTPIFQKLDDISDINYYAKREVDGTIKIQKMKNDVSYAEYAAKNEIYKETSTSKSVTSAENSFAISEMNLSDTKKDMEKTVVSLYYAIKESESKLESNISSAETTKLAYEVSKIKYDAGIVSLKELESTKYKVYDAENTLLKSVYEYMLNSDKFENLNLL